MQVETEYFPEFAKGGENPDTGDDLFPWVCRKIIPSNRLWRGHEIASGFSEQDACAEYAKANGIKLWNEEEPR